MPLDINLPEIIEYTWILFLVGLISVCGAYLISREQNNEGGLRK